MNNQLISILIPSYNRPEYIKLTLESIYQDVPYEKLNFFEVIVSDDFSPKQNEIEEAIKQFTFQNLRFFKQEKNLGEADNRKFLLDRCKGEYTIFICDDDTLTINWIDKIQNSIIKHNPDVIFFGYNLINEKNKIQKSRGAYRDLSINNQKAIKQIVQFQDFPYWYFSPVSFIARKNVFIKSTPSNRVGIADDLGLIGDILIKQNINAIISKERILNYRKFSNQFEYHQKNQSEDIQIQKDSLFLLYEYFLHITKKSPQFNNLLKDDEYVFNLLLRGTNRKLISESTVLSEFVKKKYLKIKDKRILQDNYIISKLYRAWSFCKFHLENYV